MQCPNCRTSLPPGSRFCNGCGASMGAPAANPPGPAQPGTPQRTQSMPPQQWGQSHPQGQPQRQPHPAPGQPGYSQPGQGQTQYGQTQYGQPPYGQPDNRTLGYQNPAPPPAPPAAAVPEAKRPIGLLIGIVVLLIAAVAGGTVMVVKGRNRTQASVIGAQNPSLPQGPGALQSDAPQAPAGPGVLTNRTAPPPSAPAVTGGTKKPDDMAPSVLLGSGQTPPTAPSVVSGSATPQAPAAPITAAPAPTPQQPAPPITAAPSRQPAPKAAPQPAAPPDHRDFDRYLRWLQFVEQERVALQAQGEVALLQQQVSPLMDQLEMALNPDAISENQLANRQFQLKAGLVNGVQRAIVQFRNNVMRTKPPVPADCRTVDNYFMAAMNTEQQVMAQTIQAFANNDMARLLVISRTGTRPIYVNLRQANLALKQVFKSRNLPEVFEISDSKGSGVSNLLPGMGGFGG